MFFYHLIVFIMGKGDNRKKEKPKKKKAPKK